MTNTGTTVEYLAEKLERLIQEGKGKVELWIDPPMTEGSDEPCTLYVGDLSADVDSDEVCELDYNG